MNQSILGLDNIDVIPQQSSIVKKAGEDYAVKKHFYFVRL